MNKSLKGGAAAAAASVLLLGGAGTYALWSDSVSLDGGTITSGHLELVNPSAATWTDVSDPSQPEPISITDFRVVPGDRLVFSQQATVDAEGDNLAATLSISLGSIAGDRALADALAVAPVISIDGQPDNTITETDDGKTVTVTAELVFKADATNDSQARSLTFNDAALQVTQDTRN